MSLASLIACGVYVLVIALVWRAIHAARATGRSHARGWLAVVATILVLLAVRVFQGEDLARHFLREIAASMGSYDDRYRWQLPLAGVIGLVFLAILVGSWRSLRSSKGDRALRLLRIAQIASLCFAPLYALRILSLHATDAFLYAGPVRPNWLLEISLLLMIAGSSTAYAARVRASPRITGGSGS